MLASSLNESQLECPVVKILLWKQHQEQQGTSLFPWQPVFVYFEKWLFFLCGKFTREWIVEVMLAMSVNKNKNSDLIKCEH